MDKHGFIFYVFASQREAKLQLFREAVDTYAALTQQVNSKSTLNRFCLFCHYKLMNTLTLLLFFMLCSGA